MWTQCKWWNWFWKTIKAQFMIYPLRWSDLWKLYPTFSMYNWDTAVCVHGGYQDTWWKFKKIDVWMCSRSKWVPWISGDIVRHGFAILLEMSFNAVDTSIFIDSHKMWSVPVCLKAVSSVICAARAIIQTCAVTCHAHCIRLLAGTGMNICHKVWSLRTVIPIQCTTNPCCWSLETLGKSNIWCWICPLDYYFWPVTQHLQGHQFYNKNNSGANFCNENCRNIAKMRQARQGAVGLCKKILTLTWNNCASFCVVMTVIQIMSMT